MKSHPNLALLLTRVPLGAYMAIAGWHKIAVGVGKFVSGASGMIPPYLPPTIGRAYLYAVPWAELIVGAMLIVGLFTRVAGAITALMVLSFTIAVTGWRDDPKPFNSNLILIGIAAAIALLGGGRYSLDAVLPRRKGKA